MSKSASDRLSRTTGLFDATLHLSEEATNANVAVPWAMVTSCIASAILGLGQWCIVRTHGIGGADIHILGANIAIAFCMGTDIEGILASPIDQPLAVVCSFQKHRCK